MSLGAIWTAVLLPPANILVAGFVGSLTPRRVGRFVATACLACLLGLSLPYTAGLLSASLWDDRLAMPTASPPGAIIILSADVRSTTDPDEPVTVGPLTLERLWRGAAFARRAASLPILLSGGQPEIGGEPLAALMARSLHDDFGLNARFEEDLSQDTFENATRSAAILREHHIAAVYLVTHSWHMRRAALAFDKAGIGTVAVPVRIDHPVTGTLSDFLPRPQALLSSFYALHEWLGYAYYRFVR